MPPREPSVPIELLLEAARQRVAVTNLREAAAEIGMEHSGLHKLLKGTKPQPSTVRKLTSWYLRRAASGELEVEPDVARVALAVLIQHLLPARRDAAQAQVVELLKRITASEGAPVPKWMG